jgi:hypothetical protein
MKLRSNIGEWCHRISKAAFDALLVVIDLYKERIVALGRERDRPEQVYPAKRIPNIDEQNQ